MADVNKAKAIKWASKRQYSVAAWHAPAINRALHTLKSESEADMVGHCYSILSS